MPAPRLIALALLLLSCLPSRSQMRIPASTAYLDPRHEGARVSSEGISRWTDPAVKVSWFGRFAEIGEVGCEVELKLPTNQVAHLRLSVGAFSKEGEVRGEGDRPVIIDFGKLPVPAAGFQQFTLQSLSTNRQPIGDIKALLLSGHPTNRAHFNLKPRRNAASVHLAYPLGTGTNVSAFYCEMTGLEDPIHSYYMACGWHRGYFGMQVNSPTERRIIFSVWDSGNEEVSRSKVGESNRVTLVAKGEGVNSGDFGNEGTGGHSHLKYAWKTGERQQFLVTATPTNTTHTVFAGYYFHPERREWMLVSSWNAPKDGGWLKGLYSFSENFVGSNGHLVRKARYGNQWIRTDTGRWIELTSARFSHDGTGKQDRLDRFMAVEHGEFILSHGGFLPGFTKAGDRFERPARGEPPFIPALALPPAR